MKIKVTHRETDPVIEAGTLMEYKEKLDCAAPHAVIMVTSWPEKGGEFSGVVVVPSVSFKLGYHSDEWTKSVYRYFRGTITTEQ